MWHSFISSCHHDVGSTARQVFNLNFSNLRVLVVTAEFMAQPEGLQVLTKKSWYTTDQSCWLSRTAVYYLIRCMRWQTSRRISGRLLKQWRFPICRWLPAAWLEVSKTGIRGERERRPRCVWNCYGPPFALSSCTRRSNCVQSLCRSWRWYHDQFLECEWYLQAHCQWSSGCAEPLHSALMIFGAGWSRLHLKIELNDSAIVPCESRMPCATIRHLPSVQSVQVALSCVRLGASRWHHVWSTGNLH